jgi:uncharacterized protein (TIGR03067 family)
METSMRWLILGVLAINVALPDRPAPAPVKPMVNDLAKLDGLWAVASYEFDGGQLGANEIATYPKLVIKNGTYRWTSGATANTMKVDSTTNPKQVEYTLGGQIYLGIYELNGDIFRDCIAPPGRPRPMDFTVPRGSGRMYFVYRRVNE